MRLTQAEKKIIVRGLNALFDEAAYWGDDVDDQPSVETLLERFKKEISK